MPNEIKIYGAAWCPDCILAKQVFKQHATTYEWIDISENREAATYVEKLNSGNRSVPTIVFSDGSVLVEPSREILSKKLVDLHNNK